ncbi:unnamed protein product, partial [Sphagnum compactum]
WCQSGLYFTCTYHSPPQNGMAAASRCLHTVNQKVCGGLPRSYVAPFSCAKSV